MMIEQALQQIDALNIPLEVWYACFGALAAALCMVVLILFLRQKNTGKLTLAEARAEQFKEMADALQQETDELQDALRAAREDTVRSETEKKAFMQEIERNKEERAKMEEMMIGKFENLSHKIFDEKNEAFKRQSKESIGSLLNPLQEKLQDFERKVNESFGDQAKQQFSLKEEIKNIVASNKEMRTQAEDLTNALKGDTKAQGNWGEVILERILEDSGLRKDTDYTTQGGGMGLRNDEGKLQKPDVIVNLPENKHVIIDSKVSLTHYERFFSEEQDEPRARHLKDFLDSVKRHINDLEERRYQTTEKLGTPDFVLMFIPIEAAYILAVQEDPEIQNYAWGKKVILVCPTTLFATLKTVASVWRLELQNKNAQEIAREGGLLYDKIEGFVTDMQKLGQQMDTTHKTYEKAMGKLSVGRGNILSKTEKLKELGAKTSKSLPADLIDKDEDTTPTDLLGHADKAA